MACQSIGRTGTRPSVGKDLDRGRARETHCQCAMDNDPSPVRRSEGKLGHHLDNVQRTVALGARPGILKAAARTVPRLGRRRTRPSRIVAVRGGHLEAA